MTMFIRRVFLPVLGIIVATATFAGTVEAAPATDAVTQELHITAVVPPMRRVILSPTGQIDKITSNTLDDVTPQVFIGIDTPANQRPLTAELLDAYRRYVPAGTAQYGILYQRTDLILSRIDPQAAQTPQREAVEMPQRPSLVPRLTAQLALK